MVAQLRDYTKKHSIVHFNCILCKLYLRKAKKKKRCEEWNNEQGEKKLKGSDGKRDRVAVKRACVSRGREYSEAVLKEEVGDKV